MSTRQVRRTQRTVHLIAGAAIMVSFYGPEPAGEALQGVLTFVLLPAVALSGMAMWQAPRLRRLRRGRAGVRRAAWTRR